MSMKVIEECDISILKLQDANPKTRTKEDMQMDELKESIKCHGVIVPIAVTNDWFILDGHRRYTASMLLDQPTVPVVVVDQSNRSVQKKLMDVITTNKAVSGSQKLEVYIKTGVLPRGKTGSQIKKLEEIMGKSWLVERAKEGKSPYIVESASVILDNIAGSIPTVNNKSPEILKKTILWMDEHGAQHDARMAVQNKGQKGSVLKANRGHIWKCIQKNKKPTAR